MFCRDEGCNESVAPAGGVGPGYGGGAGAGYTGKGDEGASTTSITNVMR